MTGLAVMPAGELAEALRRDVMRSGDPLRAAAVDLLISHGYWLRQGALHDRVNITDDVAGAPSAWLDFDGLTEAAALRLEGPASAMAVLRVACSLAGHVPLVPTAREDDPILWSISAMFRDLDTTSAALVSEAIQQAAGGQVVSGSELPAAGEPKRGRRSRFWGWAWFLIGLVAAGVVLTGVLVAAGLWVTRVSVDPASVTTYSQCIGHEWSVVDASSDGSLTGAGTGKAC